MNRFTATSVALLMSMAFSGAFQAGYADATDDSTSSGQTASLEKICKKCSVKKCQCADFQETCKSLCQDVFPKNSKNDKNLQKCFAVKNPKECEVGFLFRQISKNIKGTSDAVTTAFITFGGEVIDAIETTIEKAKKEFSDSREKQAKASRSMACERICKRATCKDKLDKLALCRNQCPQEDWNLCKKTDS